MKRLIIIGAGNIGRIVCEYARLTDDYNRRWSIAGFLEFADKIVTEDSCYPPIIDTIEGYVPTDNDLFICSYAHVEEREISVKVVSDKGGQFINVIHPTANICTTNKMGVGNVIGAFTTLSINTIVGNHVMIQDHCNIGHDCIIGDYSHLYVGNIVCGVNNVGNKVTVYTGSTIYPKIRIASNSTIGAGSVVMRVVKEGTTVMGNPAKKIE